MEGNIIISYPEYEALLEKDDLGAGIVMLNDPETKMNRTITAGETDNDIIVLIAECVNDYARAVAKEKDYAISSDEILEYLIYNIEEFNKARKEMEKNGSVNS